MMNRLRGLLVSSLMVMPLVACSCFLWEDDDDKVLVSCALSTYYHPDIGIPRDRDSSEFRTSVIVGYFRKAYIEDAVVRISSDSQTVLLEPVLIIDPFTGMEDQLIYSDVHGSLELLAGRTYRLDVEIPDGRKFHSFTTIPQDPRFLTGSMGDTVLVDVTDNYGTMVGYRPMPMWRDPRCYVQLLIVQSSTNQAIGHKFSIQHWDSIPLVFPSGVDLQRKDVHIFTLDSSYSQFVSFNTWYVFGADSAYNELYDKWASDPSQVFSNIIGDNVVGCFGSYSHAYTYFYARRNTQSGGLR